MKIAAALTALFFGFHLFFFLFHPTRGAYLPLSRVVVFPAAIVQGVPVPYVCIAENANAFASLYPEERRSDWFERALSRCVYSAGVKSVAKELGIPTSDDELIVAQKTDEAVLQETRFQEEPKERLEDLRGKFDQGMPFADAARKYSEDVTGGAGGDLGVFYVDAVPSWLMPALHLETDEISQVLEGTDAYWLITVGERGEDEKAEWVRFRGIAAKKVTLRKVLDDRARANPPWIFVW